MSLGSVGKTLLTSSPPYISEAEYLCMDTLHGFKFIHRTPPIAKCLTQVEASAYSLDCKYFRFRCADAPQVEILASWYFQAGWKQWGGKLYFNLFEVQIIFES